MSKLDRNRLMFFASFNGTSWEPLGKDNDELSKELNPDTETSKNVLGETTFQHSGYEPEVETDPYYADPASSLYEKLAAAAMQEKYGDSDILGYFLEVIFDTVDASAGTMSGTGFMRNAYIVPQSTGGDTAGLGIPFTVNPVGAQVKKNVVYTKATRAVAVSDAVAYTFTKVTDQTDLYDFDEVTSPAADANPTTEGWYELDDDTYVLSDDTEVSGSVTYYTCTPKNPVEEEFYEKYGTSTYFASEDLAVVSGKDYYERSTT